MRYYSWFAKMFWFIVGAGSIMLHKHVYLHPVLGFLHLTHIKIQITLHIIFGEQVSGIAKVGYECGGLVNGVLAM